MSFRILGLDPTPFRHLFGLTESELQSHGVQRHIADSKPGFPDRIELRDAEIGESLLLLNFTHQPADNPYHARHAIFVSEAAGHRYEAIDTVPDVMRARIISLHAFDRANQMVAADLAEGEAISPLIERLLADPGIDYLHAHYAKRGCYAARVERV